MAYILKCDPISRSPRTHASAPLFKTKVPPAIGEEVFIWTAELNGGEGLIGRGVLRSSRSHDNNCELELDACRFAAAPPLTKQEIAPWRDLHDGSPEGELGALLYYHSHRKLAHIEDATRDFLVHLLDS
jgi:hypothetical protein